MQKKYDLVCFDLDGTLIKEDNGDILWERMSRIIHGSRIVSGLRYDLYRKGKLAVEDWVDLDLSEWKNSGVTRQRIVNEAKHSKLNPGAKETILWLKKNGYRLAIISGSVDILLDTVFPNHPFDDVIINKINFDAKGNIISWEKPMHLGDGKGDILKEISKKENIPLSKIVFVGDHLNDIPAAKIAGLSISYKSEVEEFNAVCKVLLKKDDMREIIDYITGEK